MASQDPAKTDLVTRKFARDFEDMSCLHHSSLGFFETYFADLAEAERERDAGPTADPHPRSTRARMNRLERKFKLRPDLAALLPSKSSSSDRVSARHPPTSADHAEGGRLMIQWDIVEYKSCLESLMRDLVPPMVRSRRFAVVFVVAKCAQELLMPYSQHPVLSVTLALVAAYHIGFALAYQWGLSALSRCRRGAEELRQKVANRSVSPADVKVWEGLLFKAGNWICDERRFRRGTRSLPLDWWCPWPLHEFMLLFNF